MTISFHRLEYIAELGIGFEYRRETFDFVFKFADGTEAVVDEDDVLYKTLDEENPLFKSNPELFNDSNRWLPATCPECKNNYLTHRKKKGKTVKMWCGNMLCDWELDV